MSVSLPLLQQWDAALRGNRHFFSPPESAKQEKWRVRRCAATSSSPRTQSPCHVPNSNTINLQACWQLFQFSTEAHSAVIKVCDHKSSETRVVAFFLRHQMRSADELLRWFCLYNQTAATSVWSVSKYQTQGLKLPHQSTSQSTLLAHYQTRSLQKSRLRLVALKKTRRLSSVLYLISFSLLLRIPNMSPSGFHHQKQTFRSKWNRRSAIYVTSMPCSYSAAGKSMLKLRNPFTATSTGKNSVSST